MLDFYGIKMHDEKAYAKLLKRVEAVKQIMGSKYLLHTTNYKTKKEQS
jgi:hypothetical protein